MLELVSAREQSWWGVSAGGRPVSITSLIQDWQMGLADETKRHYDTGLKAWHKWLAENKERACGMSHSEDAAPSAAVRLVRQWVADMMAEPLKPNTIRLYFTACFQFHAYLKRAGYIEINPFEQANVRLPSVEQGVRQYIAYTPEECAKIFAACRCQRERALMAVSFGAGLRKNEVVKLVPDDYYQVPEKGGRMVHVLRLKQTKGRRDHEVALPAWAAEELDAWLVERGERPGRTIFICESATWAYDTWRDVINRAGVPYSPPHAGRATAITNLILQGAEAWQVQQVANHKNPRTTMRYFKKVLGPSEMPSRAMQDLRGGLSQPQQPRPQEETPRPVSPPQGKEPT